MEANKGAGIFAIILGLILIIFPMISTEIISIIVGVSLIIGGISAISSGAALGFRNGISILVILIGFIMAILGFLFLFYIETLSVLVSLQFYIVGFLMLILGILGLVSHVNKASTISSALVTLFGVILIILAAFAMAQPIFVAIFLGVSLIIQGIALMISE